MSKDNGYPKPAGKSLKNKKGELPKNFFYHKD